MENYSTRLILYIPNIYIVTFYIQNLWPCEKEYLATSLLRLKSVQITIDVIFFIVFYLFVVYLHSYFLTY